MSELGFCKLLKKYIKDQNEATTEYIKLTQSLTKRDTSYVRQWIKDGIITERQADILSGVLVVLYADENKHARLLKEAHESICEGRSIGPYEY